MSRKGKGERFYKAVDGESSDEANLTSDSELTSGRAKKYSQQSGRAGCLKCSRNEWICISLGVAAIAVVLVVFIGVGAGLGIRGSSSSEQDPWENVRLPSSITPEG